MLLIELSTLSGLIDRKEDEDVIFPDIDDKKWLNDYLVALQCTLEQNRSLFRLLLYNLHIPSITQH